MSVSLSGGLVGLLMLLMPLCVQAVDGVVDKIQALRSESFRACASILLSYDPYARTFDRGKSGDYLISLTKMAEVMSDPDLAGAKDEYASFSSAVNTLESSTRDVSVLLVNDVLVAQARLIAAADKLYSRHFSEAGLVKGNLHEVSVASGKLLVIYQIRPYGGLVSYPGVLLDEDTLPSMDSTIKNSIEALRKSIPQSALELDEVRRNYDFIRPRILDVRQRFVADGVKYYLGRNMARLDEVARRF